MKIDADVRDASAFFGLDPVLYQAVVVAEEGDILGAVRRRFAAVRTRDEALKVFARCSVRVMCDWITAGPDARREAFIACLAKWWTFPGGAVRWRDAVLRELAAWHGERQRRP